MTCEDALLAIVESIRRCERETARMPAAVGVAGDVLHALRDGRHADYWHVYGVPIVTAPELAPGSVVALLSSPQRAAFYWSAR